ncbi:MAG: DUF2784 domain-containing protein [Bryobacterales bacterium]
MIYGWAADLTVLLHFLFILFVIFGALLAARNPNLRYLHWATLVYALLIEIFNWYCPLTLLEQRLRLAAGAGAYERSFLVHYLERLIYWDVPQWVLIAAAVSLVLANLAFYGWRGRRNEASSSPRLRGLRTAAVFKVRPHPRG